MFEALAYVTVGIELLTGTDAIGIEVLIGIELVYVELTYVGFEYDSYVGIAMSETAGLAYEVLTEEILETFVVGRILELICS